nr:hypothetical protein [Nanoarchaeum sp.]
MALPLPKWIMQRYSILWNTFQDKEFDHDAASNVLNNEKTVSIAISKLKKNNWLEIKLDETDGRKRVYKLKSPEQAITEMGEKNE